MMVTFGQGSIKQADVQSTVNQIGLILVDKLEPAINPDGEIAVKAGGRLGSLQVTEASANDLALLMINALVHESFGKKVKVPEGDVKNRLTKEYARELKVISYALQGNDHADIDGALRTISAIQASLPRFNNATLAEQVGTYTLNYLEKRVDLGDNIRDHVFELLTLKETFLFNRHKFLTQGDYLNLVYAPWSEIPKENLSIDKRHELFDQYIAELDALISELNEEALAQQKVQTSPSVEARVTDV